MYYITVISYTPGK